MDKFHRGVYVLQFQAIYLPECLISICDVYVLQIQILHFAEELRPIDGAVFHHHIITIPDGRTAFWGEVAVCDKRTVHMPPRVFAIKLGMVAFYVWQHLMPDSPSVIVISSKRTS